ncbi:F0F1 ATP synthase subunit B [Pikeienuella piscinae]|uniref:ATP synthase subunit b n=1 Tax=Pikeienuella piscinae TaxID=2748098 RepID=A0A7L5BSY7_9RHOB|nr:F0F1 ATP synthase subunit B [Pikeienuella piscinae]QIE54212.1 F0F1 ATP synthase subunit B [Pikeienuella piscinae]
MSIDSITVAAQLINFLVLVWLLKRFLYRPILDGIDARERQIAERMSEAARVCESAEKAAAEHRAEIQRLKAAREEALEQAHREAKAERDAMLSAARARLTSEQEAREAEREQEARRYTERLHRKGAAALVALTRKALGDLSDETLEERVVARTVSRLARMAGDLKAAAGDSREAVVTTSGTLPEELRARINEAVVGALPGTQVRYATEPGRSAGLSLRLGGAQLGWTVDDYVDGLQAILDDAGARKGRAGAA